MDPDLEAFRLSTSPVHPTEAKPKRKPKTEPFLRGPIPLWWLLRAATLPGKTPLLIGLALFHLAGLRKTKSGLRLTRTIWEKFGVKRRTSYDALRALETAGLVNVARKPGSSPVVNILTE